MKKSSAVISLLALGSVALMSATGCRFQMQIGGAANAASASASAAPSASDAAPAASSAAPAASGSAAPATPGKKWALKGTKIEIAGNVVFDSNKATLQAGAGSEKTLEEAKAYLDANPKITVRIEGHTDSDGEAEANKKLSLERAKTVRDWLVGKGVKKERMIAVGFGQDYPISNPTTAEGKAINRRIEFHIALNNGKPPGFLDPKLGSRVGGISEE